MRFSLKAAARLAEDAGVTAIGISRAKVFCGLTGDDGRRRG